MPEREKQSEILENLIKQCATNDLAAFKMFFTKSYPLVLFIVLASVNNKAETQKIVSDIYLNIWEKADTYDASQKNVLAWISRITRKLIREIKR